MLFLKMQKIFYFEDSEKSLVIFAACKTILVWLVGNKHNIILQFAKQTFYLNKVYGTVSFVKLCL